MTSSLQLGNLSCDLIRDGKKIPRTFIHITFIQAMEACLTPPPSFLETSGRPENQSSVGQGWQTWNWKPFWKLRGVADEKAWEVV